jgi:type I restriction-modification system DNA methylase subunit
MNPPFALKKGDEKERDFIDYALSQMRDGGVLFAIVPISVMVEGKKGTEWRKALLEKNSILSVITLPEELFYPVSVGTVGIFIKKGIPHNIKEQKVYFARATTDGFRKKKGKRVRDKREHNILSEIHEELKIFIINQNIKVDNIPEIKTVCTLEDIDTHYEIVPESYIDSKIPTFEEIEDGIEQMIRESVGYLIKSRKIG